LRPESKQLRSLKINMQENRRYDFDHQLSTGNGLEFFASFVAVKARAKLGGGQRAKGYRELEARVLPQIVE
jgi:hypothetical protein